MIDATTPTLRHSNTPSESPLPNPPPEYREREQNSGRLQRRDRVLLLAGLVLSAGIAGLVFAFDPTSAGFFPKCILHQLTGWHCPGCGATRSLHALLHGQLLAAIRFNALFVFVGVPTIGWVATQALIKLVSPRHLMPNRPRVLGWTVVIVAILFGVLRNLPAEPFCYLAPPIVPTN